MDRFAAIVRPRQPLDTDEASTLLGLLDVHRGVLAAKCAGLDDGDLKRAAFPPSALTLLGIVRHLAEVERWWIEVVFLGGEDLSFFGGTAADDRDFTDLDGATVDAVVDAWSAARARTEEVARTHDLGMHAAFTPRFMGNGAVSLRFIVAHLLEEYARHCGHADFLREAIDGVTGW